ncbi:hypothetical protein [Natroniella sp. ANB-PHB2]|uniref:hypothetical protein n=1 Tax=Natroniella sp. ANB-PHB2 TaxID=3384444 RepID=UPI0038D4E56C
MQAENDKMTWKVAKIICQIQEIEIEVLVKCPYCELRVARLNLKESLWECDRCNKEGAEEELLRLAQENFFDKHQMAYWETRNNKGVK